MPHRTKLHLFRRMILHLSNKKDKSCIYLYFESLPKDMNLYKFHLDQ